MDLDDYFDQNVACPHCGAGIDISLETCSEQDTLYPTLRCFGCKRDFVFSPKVIWEMDEILE